jgi:CRP-like cAMP-binding protein
MKESIFFLKNYGFSEEVQKHFSDMGIETIIKKGEKILEQGKTCSFLAIIITGLFKIYHEYDGKESTIGLKYNGFITDYSSFITRIPSEVNIVAFSDCKLIFFEKTEIDFFLSFNQETQEFGRKIAEELMVSNQNILFSLLYDSAEERYNKIIRQHPELFQLFPLKDIANCIGITPETISRIRKNILFS